ncbi:MAG: hypothetical protein ABR579_11340, partial [Actinomycetota bacterium]
SAGPSASEQIEAPFEAKGRLSFPSGSISSVTVQGGETRAVGGRTIVAFGGLLGGGEPLSTTLHVRGEAKNLARPTLVVHGSPSLPDPDSIAPPSGGSWVTASASGAASGTHMLVKLFETMWRVSRLRQYDAYVGNPDPTGPATTSYSFAFAPPPPDQSAGGPVLERGSLALTVTGLLALVLLLLDALYLWALS